MAFAGEMALAAEVAADPLTLAAAQASLMERSRDLQAARFALDAARGALDSASRKPNPVLTLGAGTAQKGEYRPRDLDVNARLEQLVERGGKREFRTRAAEQAANAASLDVAETLRQLRLAVAQAYFELKAAQDGIEFAELDARALGRNLEAARRRQQAGDLARADVARIEVETGMAENEVRRAIARRDAARLALAAVLAREADAARLVAVDPWPEPARATLASDEIAAAVEHRPDVRAAAARLAAARARYDEALALRSRDFGVGVFADQNRLGNGGATVGLSVSVPLFVNNDFSGEIRQADAQRESAGVALEQARANAVVEIDRAQTLVGAAVDRLERIERQVMPSAREAARATEFAYERGALPLTDLLDARRRLQASLRELADARAEHAIARAALEAGLATGTPVAGPR